MLQPSHLSARVLSRFKHIDFLTLARCAGALVVVPVLTAALHELLLFGVAAGLKGIDVQTVLALVERLPVHLDAVHAQLALSMLTAVHPRGLAVAGAPGEWLALAFPSFFFNPASVARGAWMSALFERGSSLPGLFCTRLITDLALIILGGLLVRVGLGPGARWRLIRHPRWNLSWLTAGGLYLQAQGTWAIIKQIPSPLELEYLGAGYFVRTLLTDDLVTSQWILSFVLRPALPAVLVLFGIGLVPLAERLSAAIQLRSAGRVGTRDDRARFNRRALMSLAASFAVMLGLAVLLPTSLLAQPNVRFSPTRSSPTRRAASQSVRSNSISLATPSRSGLAVFQSSSTALPSATPTATARTTSTATRAVSPSSPVPTASRTPTPAPTPAPRPTPPPITVERAVREPRRVQVHWSPALGHFVLTNQEGELFTVRGVNYNTHYTQLPLDEHQRILHRDFKKMRDAGVNVITGFGTFDETTLRVAGEYGLSVIIPFVPDLNGDYRDPAYRDQVKAEFTAFVRRYEAYPSLLMWNFDDEPVHNLLERVRRPPEQGQALTNFLFELAEHAYQTDRYRRPSWIKEPRDWYLDFFEKSILQARLRAARAGGSVPDPNQYVVMARSAYGVPLDIQAWLPKLSTQVEIGLTMPFAVGEYGVIGVDPKDRAYHLVQIWTAARSASSIGSAVYTFSPYQPHPNDLTDPAVAAQLMLFNENGAPVDDAWEKLSEAWLAQQAEERENRRRSSIPLASSEFQPLFEQLGGYPSSGGIATLDELKQFFVDGRQQGQSIAYALSLDSTTGKVSYTRVDSVVFNELGDCALSGVLLQEYMKNGGYAKFGAPVGNAYLTRADGRRRLSQEFSKGWIISQESASAAADP